MKSSPPMIVPAIAPMETLPPPGVGLDDGDDVDVDDCEGLRVEEGERLLMHELSSELETDLTSEAPPWRPWASVMKKISDVPRATFVVHEKSVGPSGGYRLKAVPPGTTILRVQLEI